jgi:hypothetical protein
LNRKVMIAGTAGVILGGVVVAIVLLASGSAAKQSAANTASPPATAEVTRTTLVETKKVLGTLGYGDPLPVNATAPGTLTWIAPVGSTVKRGEPLFKVNEQPVVALYGSVPLYRTLRDGSEGVDVQQLEQNLAELAYTGFTVDDTYNLDTAKAVSNWQTDLGLPETGTVELGQVVFTPGAVRIAEHMARVGNVISGGSVSVINSDTDLAQAAIDLKDAQEAYDKADNYLKYLQASQKVPQTETRLFLRPTRNGWKYETKTKSFKGPAPEDWIIEAENDLALKKAKLEDIQRTYDSLKNSKEQEVLDGAGVSVLSYTGTTKLVTVELDVADQALAVERRKVTVTVPGQKAVEGEISQVGTAITAQVGTIDTAQSTISDARIEVTVTIANQEALGSLDAAPVDVDFVSEERKDVLAVPVAALLALPEAGYGVEIVEGNTTRIVAVKTGMFAAGRVEVSGEGIAEGVKIGMPK